MWRATVLTIFPGMFPGPLGDSLAGRALGAGLWSLDARDIRDARDRPPSLGRRHAGRRRPRHGDARRRAGTRHRCRHPGSRSRPCLLMSPRGRPLTQDAGPANWRTGGGAFLVCGRFEGVDERVIEARGLEEVSIGDYVLSGGEIAAMVLIDACVRLLPGVMGKDASGTEESFCGRAARIPAIHQAPGVRGPVHSGRSDLRRPRQNRRVAAGRGRTAHPGPPAGSVDGLPGQNAQ